MPELQVPPVDPEDEGNNLPPKGEKIPDDVAIAELKAAPSPSRVKNEGEDPSGIDAVDRTDFSFYPSNPRGAFARHLAEVKEIFPGINSHDAVALVQSSDRLENAKRASIGFGLVGSSCIAAGVLVLQSTVVPFMTLCGIGSACLAIAAMFLGLSPREISVSNISGSQKPKTK